MRKVIVSEFVSLDGVIEDPRWTFRFTGEVRENFKCSPGVHTLATG